jgi:hypothetical protein
MREYMQFIGLFKHRDKVGTVKRIGNLYVFTALESDGTLFQDVLSSLPPRVVQDWKDLPEYYVRQQSALTPETFLRDVRSFAEMVAEKLEDDFAEETDNLPFIATNSNEDEDERRIKWYSVETEEKVWDYVKQNLNHFSWYQREDVLPRLIGFFPEFIWGMATIQAGMSWTDLVRQVFIQNLCRCCYEYILTTVPNRGKMS